MPRGGKSFCFHQKPGAFGVLFTFKSAGFMFFSLFNAYTFVYTFSISAINSRWKPASALYIES